MLMQKHGIQIFEISFLAAVLSHVISTKSSKVEGADNDFLLRQIRDWDTRGGGWTPLADFNLMKNLTMPEQQLATSFSN